MLLEDVPLEKSFQMDDQMFCYFKDNNTNDRYYIKLINIDNCGTSCNRNLHIATHGMGMRDERR